jgi:hypothetical protein
MTKKQALIHPDKDLEFDAWMQAQSEDLCSIQHAGAKRYIEQLGIRFKPDDDLEGLMDVGPKPTGTK